MSIRLKQIADQIIEAEDRQREISEFLGRDQISDAQRRIYTRQYATIEDDILKLVRQKQHAV
ncbi:MAG: hypothetical protein ACRC6V_09305 [Bacteroidales bacterium]